MTRDTFSNVSVSTAVSLNNIDTVTRSLVADARLLNQVDRQQAAIKLREKGWSYRRIAETLQVPYILVSRWLNDTTPFHEEPKPADPEPVVSEEPEELPDRAAATTKAAPVPQVEDLSEARDVIETLQLQYGALETYIRDLLATIERDREEARERERNLLSAIEDERNSTKELIANLEREVAELRRRVEGGSGSDDEESDGFSFGGDDDPFSSGGDDGDDDPFASLGGDDDDPFSSGDEDGGDDPFASLGGDDDEDIFSSEDGGDEDPFASLGDDDPFSSGGEDGGEEDPFASIEAEEPAEPDASEPPKEEPPPKKKSRLLFWR